LGRRKQPEEEKLATRARLATLLSFVRSRIGNKDPTALTDYLNRNLPECKRFSAETVKRWERGEQGILDKNLAELAQAIEINENDLHHYMKGRLSSDRIFDAINKTETPIDEAQIAGEILRLLSKLSPLFLVEVMNKAWNILQDKIKNVLETSVQQPSKTFTIAKLVDLNQAGCLEMFEDIVPDHESRVNAIVGGSRPTEVELELISSVTGVKLDQLNEMCREEFANESNGIITQGCIVNR
jgi:hypothetical protein